MNASFFHGPARLFAILGLLGAAACSGHGKSGTTGDATDLAMDPGADTTGTSDPTTDDGGAPIATNDAGTDAARPPNTACNATDPRATPVTVAVLPDEGEKPYTDLLSTATKSVRVFGYQMGYGAVLDTLQAQAKAGLDVRVILDGNTQRSVNDKYRAMLVAAGVKFEWSNPQFSYMHAKTMIVDEKDAVVSTGNYGKSFLLTERNYVARLKEPQDVGDLVALFDADFAMMPPSAMACTRLVVSPLNSHDRLVALIASATTSILIESMQFDDTEVHDAVLARKAAGVDVQVILAAADFVSANPDKAKDLLAAGIDTRYLESPKVHVKSIVVDGKHAYLGSENISYTSLVKNREIGLIIDDAAAIQTMETTFATDFQAAVAFQ